MAIAVNDDTRDRDEQEEQPRPAVVAECSHSEEEHQRDERRQRHCAFPEPATERLTPTPIDIANPPRSGTRRPRRSREAVGEIDEQGGELGAVPGYRDLLGPFAVLLWIEPSGTEVLAERVQGCIPLGGPDPDANRICWFRHRQPGPHGPR